MVEWIEASMPPPKPKMKADEWGQSNIIWLRAMHVAKDDRGEVRRPHTFLGRCIWPKKPVGFKPQHNGANPASKVEWGEGEVYYENLYRVKIGVSYWAPMSDPLFDREDVSEDDAVVDMPMDNPDCFGLGSDNAVGCQCRKVFAPFA